MMIMMVMRMPISVFRMMTRTMSITRSVSLRMVMMTMMMRRRSMMAMIAIPKIISIVAMVLILWRCQSPPSLMQTRK